MKTIYTTKNHKMLTMTIAEASRMIDLGALPAMQSARGKVWPDGVKTQLIRDAQEGLYIPPVVLVGDTESNALSDGQQRLTTLCDAYKAGKLDGGVTVYLAVDLARTIERSFAALNVGVPVGQALVAAMTTPEPTREGILRLANHPYFVEGRKWTDAQRKKTSTAEFASACLAIASGWKNPESSTKECTKYLSTYEATPEVIELAYNTVTALADAIAPATEYSKEKGDKGKLYRATLAETRKKSVFMTLFAIVLRNPEDNYRAIRAITHGDKWLTPVKVKGVGECRWCVGGGTSGGASDYRERFHVLSNAVERIAESDAKATAPAVPVAPSEADKAVLDAGKADPDAIAEALFGGADNA